MKQPYYTRDLEERLISASKQFPVILVTGPRQAGKSTMLLNTFPNHSYVTLDDPTLRNLAQNDPALFLSSRPGPLIIDEIQYAPGLLPYLKIEVDQDRRRSGHYLLTGSQIFQLMQNVSESLAGRIAVFNLFPFSWNEMLQVPGQNNALDDTQMASQLITGFFPEQLVVQNFDFDLWFSSYVSTYLERDVRNIKRVYDLGTFQSFLTVLAARAGNLLNLSEVGRECGISQPTAKAWLTILEATSLIYILRPYFRNITKRVVKMPKIYFIDTGLLAYLQGIDNGNRFFKAAGKGSLFENMIVMEMVKRFSVCKGKTDFFFYRTPSGLEVDLIIERGGKQYGVEIKLAKTITRKHASGLINFRKEFKLHKSCIACLREEDLPLTQDISTIHWSRLFSSINAK